jgi:putative nucleotidyltransferase with HDIG domain
MVAKNVSEVLQRIQTLPPLPAAVQRLCELAENPKTTIQEMARVINNDPSLTARLLRVANSAFYGFSRRVSTVGQAVMILGAHEVRNIALSVSVFGFRPPGGKTPPIPREDFWRHALAVGMAAKQLSIHARRRDAEEAFVAGLMHDIGKVIFMEYFSVPYGGLLAENSMEEEITERETRQFGVDHAFVGEELCRHWRIPDLLTRSVADHHRLAAGTAPGGEAPLSQVVFIADSLAKIANLGNSGDGIINLDKLDLQANGALGGVWQRVLLALPAEVAKVESFLELSSQSPASPSPAIEALAEVAVCIQDEHKRTVVCLALSALGHSPHHNQKVPGDSTKLLGVVADGSLPQTAAAAYFALGLPVLDFTQWCFENAGGGALLDLPRLCAWLKQGLKRG